MRSISFDDGLKSFAINDDENRAIRFNPGDPNLMTRANKALKRIEEKQEQLKEIPLNPDGSPVSETEEAVIMLEEFERLIREEINYIFNAEVYDIVFNGQSPLCIVGIKKEFLFEAFVKATMPVIQEEVESFNAASKKRIDKYTKEYHK